MTESTGRARTPTRVIASTTRSWDYAGFAVAFAVAIGAALRCLQYLSGRSLWHDEALLALDVVDRPIDALFGRLDFAQAAPWPFVVAEWGLANSIGASEESLRLLPLTAGLASLVVFAVLARRLLPPMAAVTTIVVFAFANSVVYYAAELKPYSSDVLVTCVVLLLATITLDRTPSRRRGIVLGLAGCAAIVVSYPSLFVACPAILVLLVAAPSRGDWRRTIDGRAPVIMLWSVGVLALVVDAHRRTGDVREEFEEGAGVFETLPNGEGASDAIDLGFVDRFGSDLLQALGLAQDRPLSHLAKVVALAMVVGLVSLARRRPAIATMVALPFAATLLASRLHLYPITERTTLFLVPCVALLLGEGVWWPARHWRGRGGLALAAAATAAAVAFPAYSAAYHVVHPRKKEELRPVLEAIGDAWQPGDTVYLHPGAQYAFRYYAECGCLERAGAELMARLPFEGREGPASRSTALEPTTAALVLGTATTEPLILRKSLLARHGRWWFVYSHANSPGEGEFLERVVPDVLGDLGTQVATVRRRGAGAYLYVLP
jgi:hypothetical protein